MKVGRLYKVQVSSSADSLSQYADSLDTSVVILLRWTSLSTSNTVSITSSTSRKPDIDPPSSLTGKMKLDTPTTTADFDPATMNNTASNPSTTPEPPPAATLQLTPNDSTQSTSPITIARTGVRSPSENYPNLSATSVSSKSSTGSYSTKLNPDTIDYKKLNRGISRAHDNENIVSRARSEITLVDNVEETADADQLYIESPVYTFSLPDLTQYPDDFRTFLEKDLIALSTQVSLEQSLRLNWWTTVTQKLYPLSTSGDGNCLLHAASLGIWGFHDRLLTLRKALHVFLSQSPRKEALWRRWKYQQSKLNEQSGLVYSELEWRRNGTPSSAWPPPCLASGANLSPPRVLRAEIV
ncbi:hypothetical protein WDU94_010054 [Cyamophila willieti]